MNLDIGVARGMEQRRDRGGLSACLVEELGAVAPVDPELPAATPGLELADVALRVDGEDAEARDRDVVDVGP